MSAFRFGGWALLCFMVAARAVLAAPPCGGDCDQGGAVTVDELVRGVGIALGNTDIAVCRSVDGDGSGGVAVNELVSAVNNALNGCPSFVGEFFGTVNLNPGRGATMSLTVNADGSASGLVEIAEQTSGLVALLGGGEGTPLFSFSITGSVDLDTGAYSLSGTFLDGGTTRTVTVSGVLPLQSNGAGTFDFQLDVDNFTGTIARGDGSAPTPTHTRLPGTATPTPTPMSSGTVDPDMLGTWSGTARNESTGFEKQVRIKIELQGEAVVVTDLGGNLYKTAPASVTMSVPTSTTLTYNFAGNPIITFNLTLGDDELGGIYSATTTSIPPMIDAVGLVLTKEAELLPDPRLAGTWGGTGRNQDTNAMSHVRLRLEIQGNGVLVTDLFGDLFVQSPSSLTALPEGAPTALTYICDTGACGPDSVIISLHLSLLASGRLVGAYREQMNPTVRAIALNLGRE
jgi:hypothetical protein